MSQKIKLIYMVLGTLLLGIAISLFRHGGLGADPLTTLNLGVSTQFNLSFGFTQVIVNGLLFVPVWKYTRELMGIGTIINMLTIGYIADFFYISLEHWNLTAEAFVIRLMLTVVAVLLACLGIALYIESKMGIAPYDAAALAVVEVSKNRLPFSFARMLIDGAAVALGFVLGSTVGIATLLMAILAGPIIQFFREKMLPSFLPMYKQAYKKMM